MLIELIIEDFLAWRERQELDSTELDLDLDLDLNLGLDELKELGFAPTPDHDEE